MTVGVENQTGRMVLLDGQAGVSAGGMASVMPGASDGGGADGEQVYGLIVSGEGLAPYVDSSFRVESGMAPVELVVSSGPSGGKAADDDCAFCDLFDALNDDDEGPSPSGKAQAVLAAPPAPTNLRFDAPTDSSCTVRWAAAAGATDYDVNYKPAVGGEWTNEPHRGTGLYNTINDLEPGTEYRWAVRAENGDGSSAWVFGPNFTTLGADGQVTIRDANLRAAIEAALGKTSGAPITVAEMKTLDHLLVREADIRDLAGLESATNLTSLDLSNNNITDLSALAGLTNLSSLNLFRTNTSDLSALAGLTNLTRLFLWNNDISDLSALAGLTNLRQLALNDNNITDLSALSGLTNLTWLDLSGTNVSDLPALSGLTNLTWLFLSVTNVSDLSALSGLTNLTELDLYQTNVSDLSALSGLTNLTWLDLSITNISDLSALSGLTNLTWLDLSITNISDLSALSGLTNLTELDLFLTNISDLSALSGLTDLKRLFLSGTNISDLSALSGLTNLTELTLWENPLSFSSINDHIPALQGRGVTVLFDPTPLREREFNIELVFLTNQFNEARKNLLQFAARRWMSVITEDLPDYTFAQGLSGQCGDHSYAIPSGERIDDLRIYVTSIPPEEYFGAWGRPHLLREESHLPVVGCMAFGLRFAISLISGLHEIGHVVGFGGPVWAQTGFRQNLSWDDPNADTHFNGPLAIAAFDDAGGRNYTGAKVPVAKMDGSHWRGSVFGSFGPESRRELMTPGGGRALSAITVQSMADLGYSVDVSQAYPYTLPDPGASAKIAASKPSIPSVDVTQVDAYSPPDDDLRGRLEGAGWIGGRGFDLRGNRLMGRLVPALGAVPALSCGAGLRREPIYVVDPQGRIIRTIGN